LKSKILFKDIIVIVAGISENPGKSDGDAKIATFNFPSSVVLFNSSVFPQNKTLYTDIIYSKDSSDCIYADSNNYTSCLEKDLKTIDSNTKIDPKLIKIIRLNYNLTINSYDTQVSIIINLIIVVKIY